MKNYEHPQQANTGKVIDELDEQLCEVRNGNASPGALERLRNIYLELEKLWVLKGEGKTERWREVAASVNHDLRDAAVILDKHKMIDEHIGK